MLCRINMLGGGLRSLSAFLVIEIFGKYTYIHTYLLTYLSQLKNS